LHPLESAAFSRRTPKADIWLKAVCMFPIELEVIPPNLAVDLS